MGEEAEQKSEGIDRKLRMIETEFERIIDRAEQFEGKCHDHEVQIKQSNDRMRELEEITTKNNEAEDGYDKQIGTLMENFNREEARAEFGERTVEKLEKTIDGLDDSLYHEKKYFQEISIKIDAMLGDMKAIHDMESKMFKGQTSRSSNEQPPAEAVAASEQPKQAPSKPAAASPPTPEPTVVPSEPVPTKVESEAEVLGDDEMGPGAPSEVIEQAAVTAPSPNQITVEPGLE